MSKRQPLPPELPRICALAERGGWYGYYRGRRLCALLPWPGGWIAAGMTPHDAPYPTPQAAVEAAVVAWHAQYGAGAVPA